MPAPSPVGRQGPAGIRTVEVRPPARNGETLGVVRAIGAVVLLALLAIGARWRDPDASGGWPPTGELAPFQRAFRDVAPELQRVYRDLGEGILEAERARAATGAWPEPEELAAEAIPPFAPDPTAPVRRSWSLLRAGDVINYRGSAAEDPEVLVLVLEPGVAGELYDPTAPPDETHHLLPDGTLLHVSVWYRPGPARDVGEVLASPAAHGFTQILSGAAPAAFAR